MRQFHPVNPALHSHSCDKTLLLSLYASQVPFPLQTSTPSALTVRFPSQVIVPLQVPIPSQYPSPSQIPVPSHLLSPSHLPIPLQWPCPEHEPNPTQPTKNKVLATMRIESILNAIVAACIFLSPSSHSEAVGRQTLSKRNAEAKTSSRHRYLFQDTRAPSGNNTPKITLTDTDQVMANQKNSASRESTLVSASRFAQI